MEPKNLFTRLKDAVTNKLYYEPTADLPKTKSIVTETITEKNDYRIRQTINTWRNNLLRAEAIENPDRYYLYKTYQDILIDNHLSGIIELKKDRVKSTPFTIYDQSEEQDLDAYKFFNSQWFYQIIDIAIDSIMWGHSLIQFQIENKKIKIETVPRRFVIPEFHSYVKDVNDRLSQKNYIDYTQAKFNPYLFEIIVNDNRNLGLLSKLAPYALWKKMALTGWAEYSEIFGVPLRVAKTTSVRPEDRDKLLDWLKDLGQAGYAVFDQDQSVEIIENTKSDAYNVYKELINMCNSEMSKLILGSTMTTDDGSSYSQSNIHNLQTDMKTAADLRFIEWVMNDEVIPKLENVGLIPVGLRFCFDSSERMSINDKIKIDDILLKGGFQLTQEYIEETYNVELEDFIKMSKGSYFTPVEDIEKTQEMASSDKNNNSNNDQVQSKE
jgi:hypothetical protein